MASRRAKALRLVKSERPVGTHKISITNLEKAKVLSMNSPVKSIVKCASFLALQYIFASTAVAQTGAKDQATVKLLASNTIQAVAVPLSATHSNNDWSRLAEVFGGQLNFKEISSKTYSTSKAAKFVISKGATAYVTVNGARSMIQQAIFEVSVPDDSIGTIGAQMMSTAKKVCTVDDSASATEIYYSYEKNTKPMLIQYITSAGSGGASETITVGGVNLPKECGVRQGSVSTSSTPVKLELAVQKLKGTIKTFDGAGCTYYAREDINKKARRAIGADDDQGNGLVLNLEGEDVLLKTQRLNNPVVASNGDITVTFKDTGSRGCGEECSLTLNDMTVIKASTGQRIQAKTISICGS